MIPRTTHTRRELIEHLDGGDPENILELIAILERRPALTGTARRGSGLDRDAPTASSRFAGQEERS